MEQLGITEPNFYRDDLYVSSTVASTFEDVAQEKLNFIFEFQNKYNIPDIDIIYIDDNKYNLECISQKFQVVDGQSNMIQQFIMALTRK